MRDAHQVLKKIFDPALNALRVTGGAVAFDTIVSSGGNATIDLNTGANFYILLTENTTIDFTNTVDGKKFMVVVKQDGGGANTLAWTDTVWWENGTEPAVTPAGDAVDVFTFVYAAPLAVFLGSAIQNFQV